MQSMHMCSCQVFIQISQNCAHTSDGADVNFASVLAKQLVRFFERFMLQATLSQSTK